MLLYENMWSALKMWGQVDEVTIQRKYLDGNLYLLLQPYNTALSALMLSKIAVSEQKENQKGMGGHFSEKIKKQKI